MIYILIILKLFSSSPSTAQNIYQDALLSEISAQSQKIVKDRALSKNISRNRIITLDTVALKNAEEFDLELFDDQKITLVKTRLVERGNSSFLWEGQVLESPWGEATLTVYQGALAGQITLPPQSFRLTHVEGSHYSLEEINQASFPQEAMPIKPPHSLIAPLPGETTLKDMGTQDPLQISFLAATTYVDIVVFYTAAVAASYGNIKAEIQNGIDLMNQALERSQVSYRVRLTYRGQIDYTESNAAATELSRLAGTNDGYMDGIHALRDQYCGDVVSLWTKNTADACGVAYMLTNTTSSTNTTYSFNVVDADCANSNLSFPHEVGHNLGANHDTSVNPEDGLFSYSHGHFVDLQWRTVMAYSNGCTGQVCPRVNYYSNPNVSYSGAATGVSNVSENNRTFIASMPYVATFNTKTCTLAGEDPDNLDSANDSLMESQCFIATATYGTPYAPEVKFLRSYRDNVLMKTLWGKTLVRTYYTLSPPLAKIIQKSQTLKKWSLKVLAPLIDLLKSKSSHFSPHLREDV